MTCVIDTPAACVNMLVTVSVVLVFLVSCVSLRTIYYDCSYGTECVPLTECAKRVGEGSCARGRVCCRQKLVPSNASRRRYMNVRPRALVTNPTIPSYHISPNVKYSIEPGSVEDNVDTRIVNVEVLNNTLPYPTMITKVVETRRPTVSIGQADIVFPEKPEEESDERIKFIQMLYKKYTLEFNSHNSVNTTNELQKNKNEAGEKSMRYCKQYISLAGDELTKINTLLPNLFAITVPQNHCSKPLPLIVSGTNTSKGEFPHMAGLGYDRGEWVDFLCGGSLISDRFVLTAAHCSNTRWGPPILVRLGVRNLITDEGHNIDIEKVIVHPDYKEPASYNDIALVKLVKAPPLGRFLRPACLPQVATTAGDTGRFLTATGWGRIGYGMYASPNLQKVPLMVTDNIDCEKMFLGGRKIDKLPSGLSKTMLCAIGYLDSTHDTCQGDSGGPLQTYSQLSKCMYEVVGITSFGKLCGSGLPAIYTRVSSFMSWIEDTVWPS